MSSNGWPRDGKCVAGGPVCPLLSACMQLSIIITAFCLAKAGFGLSP